MTIFTDQEATAISDEFLFANYAAQQPERLAGLSAQDMEQIERIFRRNLASGRAQRAQCYWMNAADATSPRFAPPWAKPPVIEPSDWPLVYLQQVVQIYRQEQVRLLALDQRDDEAWRKLGKHLADSAYHLLVQKGIDAAFASDLALDIAQQTCYKIYVSTFPFDVAFDTWTHVILKNQILHQLTRSKELLDRQLYTESFDELQAEQAERHNFTLIGQVYSEYGYSPFSSSNQIEDRDWLIKAIAQLPSAERRAVIIYTFFCDLSDDEIAQQLGKSKGAVHTLRHRALKQLQGILVHCGGNK